MKRTTLTPTPAEIEMVLAGIKDGSSDFAKWLELVNEDSEHSYPEEKRLGETFFWVTAYNEAEDVCYGDCIGGGHTPIEAAAGAWVVACLLSPLDHYPCSVSDAQYLTVPRRVADGWRFEVFDAPDGGRQ